MATPLQTKKAESLAGTPIPGTQPRFARVFNIRRRETLWFYILVAPWIVGFLIFTAGPMLASLYFSFTKYDIVSQPRWVGLQNYTNLLTDKLFWQSLKVTVLYTLLSVPISTMLSLGLAVLLNQRVAGIRIFRTLFYIPTIVSGVALAMIGLWFFNADYGLINSTIKLVTGSNGPHWLDSGQWVLAAMILITLWGIGGTIVIYLAGLQGIPTELYEAAALDGATGYKLFLNVTLPLMTPVIFFTTIIGTINSFQFFTAAQVMTSGGPDYASYFYVLYLYNTAFRDFRMGYASALAWVLFIIVMVLTALAFRSSASYIHYQDGEE